jgi:DNA-binding transcriptional ArsR family regulator
MGTSPAEILLHPVRMRIVQAIAGRRLTPSDVAARLDDVPQATLYRHVKTLFEAGVLAIAEERPVRGTSERVYVLAENAASLTPEDLASATAADHLRYFTIFLSTLLGDFGRYIQQPAADLLADGVGYRQVPLELSEQEFAELAGRLNAAIAPALANQPAPGRRRRMLTTIVMPTEPEKDPT